MSHTPVTRTVSLGLAIFAVAVPGAAAQQDLRNPDTRDAAKAAAEPAQDLRSPDTRDAANGVAEPAQDLRSPDTRDAAAGRGTYTAPDVTVVKVSEPSASPSTGLDWGDAGIGAAGGLGLMLLGLGGTALILHRRHGAESRQPAALG